MQMMKTLKKSNKGITLIALVITMIVLLILAVVTISSLTGDNGNLKNATDAKKQTEIEEDIEQIKLAVVKSVADDLRGDVTESNLESNLRKQGLNAIVEPKGTAFIVTIKDKNTERKYKVEQDGNVKEYVPGLQ